MKNLIVISGSIRDVEIVDDILYMVVTRTIDSDPYTPPRISYFEIKTNIATWTEALPPRIGTPITVSGSRMRSMRDDSYPAVWFQIDATKIVVRNQDSPEATRGTFVARTCGKPTLRYTSQGQPVTNVNMRIGNTRCRCIFWGNKMDSGRTTDLAEAASELQPGSLVKIEVKNIDPHWRFKDNEHWFLEVGMTVKKFTILKP